MKFAPFPGLTLFTVIASVILLSLGTWQYQRLDWKTDLIQRIDAAANAPAFDQYNSILDARRDDEPIDFRRAKLRGTYLSEGLYEAGGSEFHVYKSDGGKTNWRIFRPMDLGDGAKVFVAGELVPDAEKTLPRPIARTPIYVSGYVRTYQEPSRFAAKSTPDANRWFSFNALRSTAPWEDISITGELEGGLYIDAVEISDLPIDSDLIVKKPDLPNNHFDYMLTWYSFALILWIIYGLLHIRAGRLSLKS